MRFEHDPRSSQVPDMFLKEFPIAPLLSLIIGGPKGRNSILQNRTLFFGEPP
jgi:hypothetical protein